MKLVIKTFSNYEYKIFALIFLVCSVFDSYSQNTFTVHYAYKRTDKLKDSLYFNLFKPISMVDESYVLPLQKIIYEKLGDSSKVTCTYKLTSSDTICSFFSDGLGKECFIIPNDTVIVNFEKITMKGGHLMLNDTFRSAWVNNFEYSGKNKFIYSLFDSIAYNTGVLNVDFITLRDLKVDSFFKLVKERFDKRILYLNSYCKLHEIPDNIKTLALSEIRSSYISNLLKPLEKSSFRLSKDPSYIKLDQIVTSNDFLNDKLFFNTKMYSTTCYNYTDLYLNKFLSKETDTEILFKKSYDFFSELYKNMKLKKYLLSSFLRDNIERNFTTFQEKLNDFQNQFPTSYEYHFLDSVYSNYKLLSRPSLKSALNTIVTKYSGSKTSSFENILQKKPTVIDCWASWCKPCIEEIPLSKKIANDYVGKVDFIYLSFDESSDNFKMKAKEFNIVNHSYIIIDNFKSDFAHYFSIKSIPRYLIFDKDGKLVTDNAPRPSKKEDLQRLLDSLLDK